MRGPHRRCTGSGRELGTRQKIQTVLIRQLSRLRPSSRRIVISQRKPANPARAISGTSSARLCVPSEIAGEYADLAPGKVPVFRRARFSGLRCLLRIILRCTISMFCLRHFLSSPPPASSSPPSGVLRHVIYSSDSTLPISAAQYRVPGRRSKIYSAPTGPLL